jgi:2-iminobutanoate/2-iminopropanoate deaminase
VLHTLSTAAGYFCSFFVLQWFKSTIKQVENIPMPVKINTTEAPAPFSQYSQAMRVSAGKDLVFVSGQVGVDLEGNLADSEKGQHKQCWRNVLAILADQGLGPKDIIEMTVYITTQDGVPLYREVRDEMLQGHEAASTLLVISGLANPDWLVEIAVIAEAPAFLVAQEHEHPESAESD